MSMRTLQLFADFRAGGVDIVPEGFANALEREQSFPRVGIHKPIDCFVALLHAHPQTATVRSVGPGRGEHS